MKEGRGERRAAIAPAISLQLLLIEGLAEALLLATATSTRRSEKAGHKAARHSRASQPQPPPQPCPTPCAHAISPRAAQNEAGTVEAWTHLCVGVRQRSVAAALPPARQAALCEAAARQSACGRLRPGCRGPADQPAWQGGCGVARRGALLCSARALALLTQRTYTSLGTLQHLHQGGHGAEAILKARGEAGARGEDEPRRSAR